MFSFIRRLFRRGSSILPCYGGGNCPYEYDKENDREIEGMPLAANDERSCPRYGHVCPEFMEDFGLTVEDLRIRATIHCGETMKKLIRKRKQDPESLPVIVLMQAYQDTIKKYPIDQFPQYY